MSVRPIVLGRETLGGPGTLCDARPTDPGMVASRSHGASNPTPASTGIDPCSCHRSANWPVEFASPKLRQNSRTEPAAKLCVAFSGKTYCRVTKTRPTLLLQIVFCEDREA